MLLDVQLATASHLINVTLSLHHCWHYGVMWLVQFEQDVLLLMMQALSPSIGSTVHLMHKSRIRKEQHNLKLSKSHLQKQTGQPLLLVEQLPDGLHDLLL